MTTKDEILFILEQNKDSFVSGEAIANTLSISRAAVWKNIGLLKADGHKIEATTKVGYKLIADSDVLSSEGIKAILEKEGITDLDVLYYPSIDSTNKEAKRLLLDQIKAPSVVIANQQTQGLGRNGKSFYSPEGNGLYFSLILKPKIEATIALRVTSAAAVATCRAIEQTTSHKAKIKWVNDIFIGERKVAGILTEGVSGFESGKIESIVVGIGINFKEPINGFPQDLKESATSLFLQRSTITTTRNELAAKLIINLLSLTKNLDDNSYIKEYRKRSLVLNKEVRIITLNDSYKAYIEHIDDNGALVVSLEGGRKELLQSGEISLRLD